MSAETNPLRIAPLLIAALALAAALADPSPAQAHIVVYKTCLTETIEAASSPRLFFERRTFARRSATYAWNAISADEFGGQYADFTLSTKARAMCTKADSGGFACVFSGIPCKEVADCDSVGSRPCFEVER
jgi:hypothetical protein